MFGYVNVLQDELKIKEYKVFKAYYCGLCKQQGKLLGGMTRLSLSYDFTVFALLLDSIMESGAEIKAGRCMLHPLAKRPVVCETSAISYSAYMSVALAYYKIKDDMTDNKFSKMAVLAPFYLRALKKVKEKYPEKLEKVEHHLAKIRELEIANCKNIDLPSAEFGKLMAVLFEFDNLNKRALHQMGYNLGRWLYIVDAIDDFNVDIKKGSYNPFLDKAQIEDNINSLWYNMSEIATAYELLDIKRNKPLIDNIIYYGIKNSILNALKKLESE